MSDREKKNDYDADEQFESRGGRKDGGTPDYEKSQSTPHSDKDFDNDKTRMT